MTIIQSKIPAYPIYRASIQLSLPFAWPTLIVMAIESPIGIINVNEATLIAI